MAPVGNKTKCLSSVNHTTKTFLHHQHAITPHRKRSRLFDVPGNFVVFVVLLLYYHHITCDATRKVAREVGEIGP